MTITTAQLMVKRDAPAAVHHVVVGLTDIRLRIPPARQLEQAVQDHQLGRMLAQRLADDFVSAAEDRQAPVQETLSGRAARPAGGR
jgi:hypothetical protein